MAAELKGAAAEKEAEAARFAAALAAEQEEERKERGQQQAALAAEQGWQWGCGKCTYRKFGVSCTDNGLCRKAGPADAKPAGVNGWGKGCGCRAQCKCAAPSAAV